MAIYNSPGYALGAPIRTHGLAGAIQALLDETVACSASPATTDTVNFGYLPPNAVITDAILVASDMDTGGSPALTINVGTAATAGLFFAASTAAQTGTTDAAMAAAGRGYMTTAKTAVIGAAGTNAATGAAGTLRLIVMGYIKDPSISGTGG